MRIFLYEYLTGGGTLRDPVATAPSGSLLREGTAMVAAVASDFSQIDGCEVHLMLDGRLDPAILPDVCLHAVSSPQQERTTFERLSSDSGGVIIIAPEFDSILLDHCIIAEGCRANLLSPTSDFIEIASDKHRTVQMLATVGLRTPDGMKIPAGQNLPSNFNYPAITKPVDGAGSLDVRLVSDRDAASRFGAAHRKMRLESYCEGLAVSVAVVCGGPSPVALPACTQRISAESGFAYLGGTTPLDASRCKRAQHLAIQAVQALPATIGYVGVDLVLGSDEYGASDVVLEINPRLTTSYVGLRQICTTNLAEAMLSASRGEPVTISQRPVQVAFDSDGSVRVKTSLDREAFH